MSNKENGGVRISLGRAFPGVIALLMPLIYLFFDLFVGYSDVLWQRGADGSTALSRFMAMLLSRSYEANSPTELLSSVFGAETVPFTCLSVSAYEAGGAYALPIAVTVACILLSVLAAALVLFSGAQILKNRLALDLIGLCGSLGAFAPAIGKVAYQLSCNAAYGNLPGIETEQGFLLTAADVAAQGLGLSVEAGLLSVIFFLFLPGAFRRLHRLGDEAKGRRISVSLPAACIGNGFAISKLLLLVLLPVVLIFVLLIVTMGGYFPSMDQIGGGIGELLTTVGEASSVDIQETDWVALLPTVAQLLAFCQVFLMLLNCIPIAFRMLGVLFARKRLSERRRVREARAPSGEETARRLRRVLLTPAISFTVFSVIALLLLALLSRVSLHLSFSNVDGTMDILYLVWAYLRSLGGVTVTYTVLLLPGALYWHFTGDIHNAIYSHAKECE